MEKRKHGYYLRIVNLLVGLVFVGLMVYLVVARLRLGWVDEAEEAFKSLG